MSSRFAPSPRPRRRIQPTRLPERLRGLSPLVRNSQHPANLPAKPATVAAFLANEARNGRKASSITRRVAGIRHAHLLAQQISPRRPSLFAQRSAAFVEPSAPRPSVRRHSRPISCSTARSVPDTIVGLRNKALLLMGFAAAPRRSELVSLDVCDLRETNAHPLAPLQDRSRAARQHDCAQPRRSGLSHRRLEGVAEGGWIEAGPVFRPVLKSGRVLGARLSDRAVANIVKSSTKLIALDPGAYSGHSFDLGS